MPALVRATILFGFLLFGVIAGAQTPSSPKESKATGSVTGRVTVDGKPKAGIEVEAQRQFQTSRGHAKATTDEDGRFLLTGLEPGRYLIIPTSPIYVDPNNKRFGPSGKALILAEAEAVEGIDFALAPGGVITGRVTDASGQPVVEERVTLTQLIEVDNGASKVISRHSSSLAETDDRGGYRIYGLSAGRYILSAGGPSPTAGSSAAPVRPVYPRAFHPDVTDEARAKIIELAAGTEAADVNIKLGPPIRIHAIAGRLIDAETGRAAPNISFSFGSLGEDSRLAGGLTSSRSDDKGEFRIEGLMPGRYTFFAMSEDQSGFYSEPATVVLSEEDVNGVELNLLRGASIGGRAVIEGTADPAVLAKLPQLRVMTFPSVPGLIHSAQPAVSQLGPDGSFLIRGLRGGKTSLHLDGLNLKGFTLLRVERGGLEQHGGIDLAPNEQVTDARLVIAYGAEIMRGQIKVDGGAIPEGARIMVFSRRIGPGGSGNGPSAEVDSQGKFTLEGLTVGDYELTLIGSHMPPEQEKRLVNVASGKETNVVLTLNVGAKAHDK
jgi:uncharacterized protein DUF4198